MTALDTKNVPRNYSNSFVDASRLNVIRPVTKHITEVRFIPEIHADGSILPASLGVSPSGEPLISNLEIFNVTVAAGETNKFTGITDPGDTQLAGDVDNAFAGTWIRLKKRLKTPDQIEANLFRRISKLMAADNQGHSIVPRPVRFAFMQCVVLVDRDKVLPKPGIKQLIAMSPSAVTALSSLFKKLFSEGVDPFSPDNGVTIKFFGIPPDPTAGRNVASFACEVGRPLPMKADICRKLWVPWEKAFRRYTQAELIEQATKCYGYDIMSYVFPEVMSQYPHLNPGAPTPPPAATRPITLTGTPVVQSLQEPAPAAPPMALDISDADLDSPPTELSDEEAPAAPPPAQTAAPAARPAAQPTKPAEASAPKGASVAPATAAQLEAELRGLLEGADDV